MLMRFMRPVFRFSQGKNYYELLGVQQNATLEQIESAYNKLAGKYYPGVRTSNEENEYSKQFQAIAEAYAVLSVRQSRNAYDLSNKKQENLVYSQDREQFIRNESMNKDGFLPKNEVGYDADTYAAQRIEQLRLERERFNVDEFGRYRGGIPVKDQGNKRGNSLGKAGSYHNVNLHNTKTRPVEQEIRLDSTKTEHFKAWSEVEQSAIEWKFLYQKAAVDYEYLKMNSYREFFRGFRNIILLFLAFPIFSGIYVKSQNRKITAEVQDMINQGKDFVGSKFGHYKVAVGPTGTLKMEDIRFKHPHH